MLTTRPTRGDVFGTPSPLMGADTFAVEADPDLSPDREVVVFSANLPLQLHAAIRTAPADAFGSPFALVDLAGPNHDGDPAFSPDGCELFWISDRGGDRDLYHATIEE